MIWNLSKVIWAAGDWGCTPAVKGGGLFPVAPATPPAGVKGGPTRDVEIDVPSGGLRRELNAPDLPGWRQSPRHTKERFWIHTCYSPRMRVSNQSVLSRQYTREPYPLQTARNRINKDHEFPAPSTASSSTSRG